MQDQTLNKLDQDSRHTRSNQQIDTQVDQPLDHDSPPHFSSHLTAVSRVAHYSHIIATKSTSAEDVSPSKIPIPTCSSGLTTFGYQLALRNRMPAPFLERDSKFDPKRWTPIFVHDVLMLPGSLADLLNKPSQYSIINRMTPAILHDFHPNVHPDTLLPCLRPSGRRGAYVQGILVFGEGTRGRDKLTGHYRPHSRRVKVAVEFEVMVLDEEEQSETPGADGSSESREGASASTTVDGWRPHRREVMAHAYVYKDEKASREEPLATGGLRKWTLEAYLEGRLG